MAQTHAHVGHRSRLRKRLAAEGLDNFEPHEVLELMLYESIPQRDVNPLAHLLSERFGGVSGVLRASREELLSVPGVGERTADCLKLLSEAAFHYAGLTLSDRPRFTSAAQLIAYCTRLFDPGEGEQVWIFNMNKAGHLLGSTRVATGDWTRTLTLRIAVEPTLRYHGQTAILLQCRKPGDLKIRAVDLEFTRRLSEMLMRIRVALLDSVLLSGRDLVSMRKQGAYALHAENALREPEDEAMSVYLHWLDEP